MGEPLLNKDFFNEVRFASSKGINVRTVTNGSLLNKENCVKILSSSLKHIMISMDGANSNTHNNIRKGSDLDKLIENIKYLITLRNNAKIPFIEMWSVGQKKNIGELLDMVKLCSEIGVDKMSYQITLGYWGKEEWKNKLLHFRLNEKEIEPILRGATKLARELGFDFEIYKENKLEKTEGKRCWWPWWSCYITADGYVTPCCVVTDPKVFNIGNLFEKSFSEIWNGHEYQKLREQLSNDNLPSFCTFCYID
jgi:radical SAM protein with 4Fe4S-binding SPASM domain